MVREWAKIFCISSLSYSTTYLAAVSGSAYARNPFGNLSGSAGCARRCFRAR